MPFTNYHSHTRFDDGKAPHEEYILAAIKQGMVAYGFSGHGPVPFKSWWNMKKEEIPEYLNIIDELKTKYKDKIQIYSGLEVDFITGRSGPGNDFIQSLNLDYIIGAIHYMDDIGKTNWDIDATQKEFDEGLHNIYKNDVKAFLQSYFGRMRQMLQEETPDVLAHIDKIKTKNPQEKHWKFIGDTYLNEIDLTLDAAKKHNCIIEVNTRGVYTGAYPEFYPNEIILKMALEKGVKIMVNADTHKPQEVAKGLGDACQTLKNIGFKEVYALLNGKWQAFSFDENGIVV